MNRKCRVARLASITVLAGVVACTGGAESMPADTVVPPNPNAVATGCPGDNAGLILPTGFCASVFAEGLLHARHVVVAVNGDVYVALEGLVDSPEAAATRPHESFAALRDTNSDGHADIVKRIGEFGNTGIGIFNGYLYVDEGQSIVRYARLDSQLVPGKREVILRRIPLYPQHISRNFAFGPDGSLYVNLGSATNSCQVIDRTAGSPGRDPCDELLTRAGIWRYRADVLNQVFSPSERFASGLRNALGLVAAPDGKLYATQHGRDQLHQLWFSIFPNPDYENANPAEELVQVNRGDDFGWPYCYYAADQRKLIDAPEYGGNGTKNSRCVDKKGPIVTFQAHWAPMSLMFYDRAAFPERYRHGAFIAFHGSWKRPPEPAVGYRIVFQPLANGKASGPYEVFAAGFAQSRDWPSKLSTTLHRPTGMATSPDGAIFVTDDNAGRIYKITYHQR